MANPYIEALAGNSWIAAGFDNEITYFFDDSGLRAWSEAEKTAFRDALQSWADVANIVFTESANIDDAEMTESLVSTAVLELLAGENTVGLHTSPDETGAELGLFAADGTAVSNVYAIGNGALVAGSFAYQTIVHEIGHALGLAHPHDNGQGTTLFPGVLSDSDLGYWDLNQDVYTILSYNNYDDGGFSLGSRKIETTNVAGPMAFDIAAIQSLYGANTTFHTGDDTYHLDAFTGSSAAFFSIWDAGGTDSIAYSGTQSVSINLQAATLDPEIGGAGGFVSAVLRGFIDYTLPGGFTIANGVVIENATAGDGNDYIAGNDVSNVLVGGKGSDHIFGGAGTDTLFGGEGDDELMGGEAADSLHGGAGDDTYFISGPDDVIVELADEGNDSIYTSSSYSLLSLPEIENVAGWMGTGALQLTGNAKDNVLTGGGWNDVLDGRGGADLMSGGSGNDTYYVDSVLDRIDESFASGQDTVVASALSIDLRLIPDAIGQIMGNGRGYGSANEIENVTLSGTSPLNAFGNALGNKLIGNSAANSLSGFGDWDELVGNAGNDTLFGGSGRDVLTGGAGRDVLSGGAGGDVFDYNSKSESRTSAAKRDKITDFSHNRDNIDLHTIDANTKKAGNQNFKFIGKDAFHKIAGELHFRYEGGSKTIVEGDVNGDGRADFQIELAGHKTLTAGDFIL